VIQIREVNNANEKSDICNIVLRALPNWFGVEASIVDYIEKRHFASWRLLFAEYHSQRLEIFRIH